MDADRGGNPPPLLHIFTCQYENKSQFVFNPLALELNIYSLAHHLCKMSIFYEPRRITLGNTRHFVEE